MKDANERKVSSIVALSVTILAVVTALAFSFATVTYQREVAAVKKINADYMKTIMSYRLVLEDIKQKVAKAGMR